MNTRSRDILLLELDTLQQRLHRERRPLPTIEEMDRICGLYARDLQVGHHDKKPFWTIDVHPENGVLVWGVTIVFYVSQADPTVIHKVYCTSTAGCMQALIGFISPTQQGISDYKLK